MHPMMMMGTQKDAVFQIGGAGVTIPPADVVRLRVRGRMRAAAPGAAAVTLREGVFLRRTEQPLLPTQIEDFTPTPEDHRDQVRIRRKPAGSPSTDRQRDFVYLGGPEAGAQIGERDAHDHRDGCP
jgi:hypothetical protein